MWLVLEVPEKTVGDCRRAARLAGDDIGDWCARILEMHADLSLREPPVVSDDDYRAFLEDCLERVGNG